MAKKISILYGTETGNSEYCAEQMEDAINAAGFDSQAIDMQDFTPSEIASQQVVFIVTSTFGNGGPPFNAEALLRYLQTETIDLSGLHFAICGLGDTSFDHFAQCGKDFEQALKRCSAIPMFDRVDCDTDYEPVFEEFQESAIAYLQQNEATLFSGAAAPAASTPPPPPPVSASQAVGYTRDRPFLAPLLVSKRLSKPGSTKETMHYEIDLTGSNLSYRVGDCFGVYPNNQPEEVQAILSCLQATGSEQVTWNGADQSFVDVLNVACLQRITMDLMRAVSTHAGNQAGPAAAAIRAGSTGTDAYRNGHHVVDILKENAVVGLAPQTLVSALRKMAPRLYSVASSPTADPSRVAFVIETLRYDWNNRAVQGVASCWLADRVSLNQTVPVYVVKNDDFLFPKDQRPVIMVGPGTGIAPFRAYLAEKEAAGIQNKTWLFFGHRNQAHDFLYREELERFQSTGVLNRVDYAWSRDQDHKIYVQDRIAQQGRELWEWLNQGALVYVCGDAKGMAPAVAKAFAALAEQYGGVSDGSAWLESMRADGRYLTDVY